MPGLVYNVNTNNLYTQTHTHTKGWKENVKHRK